MWSHISNSFLGAGASYCMAARSRATAVSKLRTLGQIFNLMKIEIFVKNTDSRKFQGIKDIRFAIFIGKTCAKLSIMRFGR